MSIKALAAAALRDSGGDVEKALAGFAKVTRKSHLHNDLARVYLRTVAAQGEFAKDLTPRAAAAVTPASNVTTINIVREQRRQTAGQRMAARKAMLDSVEAVYEMKVDGRALGRIKFGELATLKREFVADAANMLRLGHDFARNAVLAELIEEHCVTTDQFMEIRHGIAAKKLAQLVAQANKIAPRRIAEAMRLTATALETKEIAQ